MASLCIDRLMRGSTLDWVAIILTKYFMSFHRYLWSSDGAFASQHRHLGFKSLPIRKSTALTESLRGITQFFRENTGIFPSN
jgi:hypothetical protein